MYEQTYFLMGRCYYNQGRQELALKAFEKARLLNPSDAQVYIWIGSVYGTRGDYLKALDFFKESVRLEPANTNAYFNMAISYIKLNRPEDARAALETAEKIKETDFMQVQKLAALRQALEAGKTQAPAAGQQS